MANTHLVFASIIALVVIFSSCLETKTEGRSPRNRSLGNAHENRQGCRVPQDLTLINFWAAFGCAYLFKE